MVRSLLSYLLIVAGGIVLNVMLQITTLMVLLMLAFIGLSTRALYTGLYRVLVTPVVPLYAYLSQADSWYNPPRQGALILCLVVLNGVVWGLIAAGSVAVLRRVLPGQREWTFPWPDPDDEAPTRVPLLAVLVFGLSLALLSLLHINPAECATHRCAGAQVQAGFPLVIVADNGGDYPPSGWGDLGIEDYNESSPAALAINALFYSVPVWLACKALLLVDTWRRRGWRPGMGF